MTVRVVEFVEHVRPTRLGTVVVDEQYAVVPLVHVCTQAAPTSVSHVPS